jgi:hypothetical protein
VKHALCVFLLAVACVLAGCASSAQSYIAKHPELSADQRKILKSGIIPDGIAVAGMTKEQIRLAMGSDPNQFTKVDGADAWVYVREKTGDTMMMPNDETYGRSPGMQTTGGMLDTQAPTRTFRTTIVFQGDRAVRAEVSEEKPAQ